MMINWVGIVDEFEVALEHMNEISGEIGITIDRPIHARRQALSTWDSRRSPQSASPIL